jgi:hypothetical protein
MLYLANQIARTLFIHNDDEGENKIALGVIRSM